MSGSALVVQGTWSGEGVFNLKEMDPDSFMGTRMLRGLPWTVEELAGPVDF